MGIMGEGDGEEGYYLAFISEEEMGGMGGGKIGWSQEVSSSASSPEEDPQAVCVATLTMKDGQY